MTVNQLYLHFSGGSSICSEGEYEFYPGGSTESDDLRVTASWHGSPLSRLLEVAVVEATIESGDTLRVCPKSSCWIA